ncbi:MAG: LysM domain-containing protein, partial [Thermodesulfobacteriota bacterium]
MERAGKGRRRGWRALVQVVLLVAGLIVAGVAAAAEVKEVIVQKGDTVASLSLKVYKTYNAEIAAMLKAANPELMDLNRIRVGQRLRFPSMAAGRPAPPAAAAAAPARAAEPAAPATPAAPAKPAAPAAAAAAA